MALLLQWLLFHRRWANYWPQVNYVDLCTQMGDVAYPMGALKYKAPRTAQGYPQMYDFLLQNPLVKATEDVHTGIIL